MPASRGSMRANTSSREPGTVKPLAAAGRGADAMPERVTLAGASGRTMAELVSGRSRSGGTSRGRSCGAAAYRSWVRLKKLQPEVATSAATTAAARTGRDREREGCMDLSWEFGSGRACGQAFVFEGVERRGDAVGAGMVRRRQRAQRQADAVGMADAAPRQQRLHRDRVGLHAAERDQRVQPRGEGPAALGVAGARQVAQA